MESNYKAWHNKTEAALAADVRAAEDKAAAEAAARAARHKQQRAAAHMCNQQQLECKAAVAEANRAQDRAFRAAWEERLQQLREEERREAADARASALEVQRFQQWQGARRTARRAAAAAADEQDALMAHAAVESAEEEFAACGAALREEAAARGLPVAPIDKYIAHKESPLASAL